MPPASSGASAEVSLITLGYDKNTVDTEPTSLSS
jgi:hypothetical protein